MSSNKLTNLLPSARRKKLRRGYFLRLGVVGVILAIVLTLISAAFLMPTYVFLVSTARTKQARLAQIESTLVSSNESAFADRLAALSRDAQTLIALQNAPGAATNISAVLSVAHAGIPLNTFNYTPPAGSNPGTITVSGTAPTRDALRSYQLALLAAPFVASANLPVSTYATGTKIPFSIVITLAP